ncbi:hypothetical protein G6F22_019796 [Rhizopus arrhizus]|nr:hypothetical protein G6F22_019796 [Rhizopus arrhizus]
MPERNVHPGEYGELRQAFALVRHRPLRFGENVHDVLTHAPGLAGAQSDGDVVVVLLQVERPRRRRPHIPALRQIADQERLECGRMHGIAVVLPGKRMLPFDQRAHQTFLAAADDRARQAAGPFAGPCFGTGRGKCRKHCRRPPPSGSGRRGAAGG